MAASGYTPISLYYSTTASAVPTAGNLANGELGLNIADMKLYAKNSSGVVTLLASNAATTGVDSLSFGSTGLTPSTATTGAVTVAGTLATTNGGTGLTSFTSGGVVYASSTSALAQSANLTFNGTTLTASNLATTGVLQFSTNAAQAAGSIAKNATYGLTHYGITGSSYDVTLLNYLGNVALGVTTGTQNLVAGGSLLVTTTLTANTAIRVGAASSDELLTINGSSAGFVARIINTSATNPNGLYVNSTNAVGTGTAFRVDSAGTALLTLNGTGLGIGTAPSYKLDINKGSVGIVARFGGGGTSGILYSDTTFCAIADSSGANGINIYGASNYLAFNTGSTQRFVFGASGQFGIGATPSYGNAGEVLTSGGASAAPTWAAAGGGGTTNGKLYFYSSFN